jgi:ATP-dependent Lon protease
MANSEETMGQGAETQPTLPPLPSDAMIIVPVRSTVLFPGMVLPISVGRPKSVAAAQWAVQHALPMGLLLQRDAETADPTQADLYPVGTVATVLRYITAQDGTHHFVCQGQNRFRVVEFLPGYPFLVARVEQVGDVETRTPELEARLHVLRRQAEEALELLPQAPPELGNTIRSITSASTLADLIAGVMDIELAEKQEVLEIFDVSQRLKRVSELMGYRIEVLRLSKQISQQTKETVDTRQREFLLREQLKTIQKELGESDDSSEELDELRKRVEAAKMPPEVEQQAKKELTRLSRMQENASEYGMVRAYVEWLAELPWSVTTKHTIDIGEARKILDEDHFGLPKIKRRILEYLAVQKLKPGGKSPILCFVGPPGVGKTSLGQSIARATGRKFVRVSLGGVHDEAEIRGHRRTYIGALPGNIIQGLRKAGARDCVMMLDEIDKLGSGIQGDPSAALLEVLDPEQNGTFRDNYLAVPFDLSSILFIATANVMDTIPGPLRDRMEVIELSGYTEEEKLQIAKRYLVRRQLEANGLADGQVTVADDALRHVIRDYTREAGVRGLERTIGAVMRNVAMRVAEGTASHVDIDEAAVITALGQPRFEDEVAMRTSIPGVATGLAWTPVGGDILFIEATRTPGGGRLILTGQLGDVMKESAQAALSLVKSRARALGIDEEMLAKSDIHIHVPAGAIPKDGPSAGVAMTVALISLLTNRATRSDAAMTGEISLRGLVLPVGGIKEKVTAAARAGITLVALPARNRRDYDDIPEEVRQKMRFVWCDRIDDAVAAVIGEPVAVAAD